MPILPILLAQLAAQSASAISPPDIEVRATVTAREVTVHRRGTAKLEVHASPPLDRVVKVVAPPLPAQSTTLRDVVVTVEASATIAPPDQPPRAKLPLEPGTKP